MPKSRQSGAAAGKRILVGRIGAAHGVSGAVRLTSFTQDPQAIAAYGPLGDAAGARFEIVALRPLKDDVLVARFVGVVTREAAEALNGTELFVARTALPRTAEEEFYYADLVGLAARNPAGELIGRVVNVLNFGGGDILEIEPRNRGETLLVPFTKEAVPRVDVKAGRIIILPPVEIEAETSLESDLAPHSAPRGR